MLWFVAVLAAVLTYLVWAAAAARLRRELFVGGGANAAGIASGTGADSLDQRVVNLYQTHLGRNPSGVELARHRTDLVARRTTLDGVARELKGGDEYLRRGKVQADGGAGVGAVALMPELPRIVADRDLMDRIAALYKRERKKAPPKGMLLPLRDVYMMLNYSDAYFLAFLRQKKYAALEEAVANDPEFDRDKLIAWMQEHVDEAQLERDAQDIQAQLDAENAALAKSSLSDDDLARIQAMIDAAGLGNQCAADHSNAPDGDEYLRFLRTVCQYAFDKDGEAPEVCQKIQVPTHVGNPYVLRPEFAWALPQPQPPVCTSLGRPSLVQPTVAFSDALGVPLDEAQDTAVGSIMPDFDFQQYVDARPTAAQCKAAGVAPAAAKA